MMSRQARQIRTVINEFDGAWVRVWRDGSIWCGLRGSTGCGLGALKDRLEDRGYRVEQNGQPGTAGEFILDVFEPEPLGGRRDEILNDLNMREKTHD